MKRGFLSPSRKEPAGLCTIRTSKREVSIDTLQAVSIDTLQAASIDSIHHQSIDTIHPTSIDKRQATVIDRANKSSKTLFIKVLFIQALFIIILFFLLLFIATLSKFRRSTLFLSRRSILFIQTLFTRTLYRLIPTQFHQTTPMFG